jgi:cytoskeletal protein CcmA (bactofilin family)
VLVFRRRDESTLAATQPAPAERVTSVLGQGVVWKGQLSGTGGVRIEGSFEGEINLRGLLVVGETGRVTSTQIRARVLVVAGAVRGDILAEKVEIRSTGRVWGNLVTAAFATEEGAFLRGQIRMEERVDITATLAPETETQPKEETAPTGDQPVQEVALSETQPAQEAAPLAPQPEATVDGIQPPSPSPLATDEKSLSSAEGG